MIQELSDFSNIQGNRETRIDLEVKFDGINATAPLKKIMDFLTNRDIGENTETVD